MFRRSLTNVVLVATGVALVGCPAARDSSAPDKTDASSAVAPHTSEVVLEPPSEPSIRYFPLDTPAGMGQAVVVEGFPLVHTRQLLPLDGEGNLVGEASADQQIEQVLANLQTVLVAAGSGLEKLVRLNIYADSPQTANQVRVKLSERLDAAVRPAITSVVTPLPHPQALVAVDAVAVSVGKGDSVVLLASEDPPAEPPCADAAVMPQGGVVYFSGQVDKSPLAEATVKSLTKLLDAVAQLNLERSRVVQLKVFIDSAQAADEVLGEIKQLFPDQLVPPVVFVEWIASAPIEIEMIVHLPLQGSRPDQPLRFETPSGEKPSPVFSRVAVIQAFHQIYISGLTARAAGNGEAQVRDVFAQLQQILAETGSDLRHLAKATYYVSDEDASNALNELRPEFYDPQRPPAASKAMVHGVADPNRTLTMDLITVRRGT